MGTEYLHFLETFKAEKSLALAILLRTSGSTPQVPGSTAVFNSKGILSGTLGGGLLEFEAEKQVKKALKDQEILILEYDLNADTHDPNGAICGGRATILIDPHPLIHRPVFQQACLSFERRKHGALITVGKAGPKKKWKLDRYWVDQEEWDNSISRKISIHEKTVLRSIREGVPRFILPDNEHVSETGFEEFIFIDPVQPPERLIMVGGGHIGKALINLGAQLGFELTLLDNRTDTIDSELLPSGTALKIGPVDNELSKISMDPDTFIVIATQGHQHDAEALRSCIRSEAAYIGLMGSKRKIRLMRERFIDEGWATAREYDAVHAPVGLDIHAETVQEIAVSIAAELVKVRRELKERRKIPYVYGMVLAAGESRRMRQQKLLMEYQGESFIRNIVRKSIASELDQTLVVLGSHSREVYEEIESFQVESVFNPLFKEGMLSSIQCGFNAIPNKVDAVVLLLGDQPMVETGVINRLVEYYREKREKIIVPVHQGERGHPVLIDISFKEEIFALDPEKGLRELIYSHPDEVFDLEIDSPTILKDIDNIEDYNIEIT